jgi:hypothetical protein
LHWLNPSDYHSPPSPPHPPPYWICLARGD